MENAFGTPFFEIHGRRELLADGVITLLEYDAERIVLLCGGQKLAVRGTGLRIALLSASKTVICGQICGVDFL